MSLALHIDPETRDIVVGEHDAVFTEHPTPELLLAIGVRRGSLWQDPDQGSDIPAIVSNGPAGRRARGDRERGRGGAPAPGGHGPGDGRGRRVRHVRARADDRHARAPRPIAINIEV